MPSKAESNACADRRERRRLLLSACCATLGCAFLLLAACSAPVVRHAAVVPPPLSQPSAVPDLAVEPKVPNLIPATPASPWPRLRARYALPGCDYSPTVRQFATQMAASPTHLSDALKQAMPFIL